MIKHGLIEFFSFSNVILIIINIGKRWRLIIFEYFFWKSFKTFLLSSHWCIICRSIIRWSIQINTTSFPWWSIFRLGFLFWCFTFIFRLSWFFRFDFIFHSLSFHGIIIFNIWLVMVDLEWILLHATICQVCLLDAFVICYSFSQSPQCIKFLEVFSFVILYMLRFCQTCLKILIIVKHWTWRLIVIILISHVPFWTGSHCCYSTTSLRWSFRHTIWLPSWSITQWKSYFGLNLKIWLSSIYIFCHVHGLDYIWCI